MLRAVTCAHMWQSDGRGHAAKGRGKGSRILQRPCCDGLDHEKSEQVTGGVTVQI